MPKTGITVSRGMTHDGIGKYMSEVVTKAPGETDDVVGILKETGADVVVNYLPVGSEEATKWYAEQILAAGCAMVNCMPVFIAREQYWQRRFEEAGVPIIGDDIKSQVGATITHRVLTTLFRDRGVHLDKTMQLNVGGNSDFLNMLERDRLESKKISKTNAVTSMLDYDLGARQRPRRAVGLRAVADRPQVGVHPHGGPSFGDVPLNVELKLEVWDSPNSAGIVIDAVRLAKLALNNGVAGALEAAELVPDEVAAEADPRRRGARATERFIKDNTRTKTKVAAARPDSRLEIEHSPGPRRCASWAGPVSILTAMQLRVCLVTPFAWSQPHDVNEHVAGVARRAARARAHGHGARAVEPRRRPARGPPGAAGGEPTPTSSPSGRRCRSRGAAAMGVPVGVRANLTLALARRRLRRRPRVRAWPAEPLLPGAPRDARRSRSRRSSRRTASRYPPGKAQRERLLGAGRCAARDDARGSRDAAGALPRATTASSRGASTRRCSSPRRSERRIVVEWRPAERPSLAPRSARSTSCRTGSSSLLRTQPLAGRPYDPASPRATACTSARHATPRRAPPCSPLRASSSPLPRLQRVALEAAAAGARSPRRRASRAAGARRRRVARSRDESARARRRGARRAEAQTSRGRGRARRPVPRLAAGAAPRAADPLADRDWILCDLHMHTSWSHDCSVEVDGAARLRRGAGPRGDRGHRPQRRSAARSRPSSRRAGAISSSFPARRSRPTARAR